MADAILADVDSSGIYQILNLVNGKRYIGSAVRFRTRWAAHRHQLRNGFHHSRHLQSAWNKYGEDSFEFSVIELCEKSDLIAREQFHLDQGFQYNQSPTAGSPLGVKWSLAARLSASRRRAGVAKSDDHVEKMRVLTSLQWSDKSVREKMSDAIKHSYGPELLEFRRDQQKRNWEDPDTAQRMRDGIRNSYTDELRALRSAQSKARWADPVFRARMTQIRRDRKR